MNISYLSHTLAFYLMNTPNNHLSHFSAPTNCYEIKQIIDTHNRHLKKQKKIDDLADKLRKEQSTFSGRKRLKNKQKTLASERKRLQRASQCT